MFKYIVVDEDYGLFGLDDVEMAREIACYNIVIDVQAGRTIEAEGSPSEEIKSWTSSFPEATVGDAFGNGTLEDSGPSAGLNSDD